MATLERSHATLDEIERNTNDPLERASGFFLQQFDNWLNAREGRDVHRAALLEIASLKDDHRQTVEHAYIDMFKRLRGYIRAGIESGQLRPVDATSATRALIGSVDWVFYWLHQIPEERVPEVGREALSILARGIYAGKGTFKPSPLSFESSQAATTQGFDREQQNRMKQEAFFRTGTWFFNKKGFNGASLDEIAEHLNVSKGAFYYHIKNKEDLLFNCYSHSLDIVEEVYAQAADSDGSGLEKVERACREIFQVQNSDRGPLVRYSTITALPTPRRREILARTEANNRRFGDFIRAGIADGSVREVDPEIAQNLISGATNAAMDISLWRRVDNIDDAAIDYFDIFFNGLLPRPEA